MQKNTVLVILIFLIGCSCPQTSIDKRYLPLEEVILKARDRVFPALVHISLVKGNFSGGKDVKVLSVGIKINYRALIAYSLIAQIGICGMLSYTSTVTILSRKISIWHL